ncbi:MAG: imidazole glycerol phosphate synthase subunit HisH [Paracoccus sp. (in: a-proteobacteria)]|uniref:imidazole glycerol phosphate synthase subunit HisH n=1 Tax=Paracoccus sp. TaxID=267 RepID=UPI0026DF0AF5|nr:imidazole glycerol phosphate synthase subunit HisH [Paracoccus sp. (in: a-proteobacteria)]MDO5620648.1 imidazole glycerol phosphate synthase subunit HisH [Paracoccus sp. (in: a-proteobacteria)]
MRVALVDYDSGNLHSAEKAFALAGRDHRAEVIVTRDPDQVRRADRIVLPGDGAFPACRAALDAVPGMVEVLRERVLDHGTPFIGICVGMQMLATTGLEYRETPGLGWIPGRVEAIRPADPALKVPHMGWNDLVIDRPHPVLDGIATGDHAYFVHSWQVHADDPAHLLAHVDYAGAVTAIIGRGNIIGTQFHPEKSQAVGLRLISNWMGWRP